MQLGLDKHYGPFIDNRFATGSGERFDARDPATGELLATLTECGAAEVDAAVAAARAAQPGWAATPIEERSRLLWTLADRLAGDMTRRAHIDAHDIGRRLGETTYDQIIAVGHYRYFAAAIMTHEGFGRAIPNGHFIAKREPLGVCAQVVPWNVPTIMAAAKIAPAVAAGNTVVLKPDEHASLSTMELCKLIAEIFPPGVINVIPGRGAVTGQALIHHKGVAKISFTGSTEVGRLMAAAGAEALLPVTLELGGKSANIVFPDVTDFDAIADNVAFAAMYCNGQSCLAGTRLFVHEDVYRPLMDALCSRLARAVVAAPFDEKATLSCLVSEKQGRRVLDYIDVGRKEGARLLTGGSRRQIAGCEAGYFIEPTVFEARNDMRICREEIFGPVLSVIRWSDYEVMLAQANDSTYGLAAGLYTRDISRALDTADRLQAGSVWVNQYFNLMNGTPFGGYKQSGLGREFCHETLNYYTQLKSITLAKSVPSPFYVR
ncbi:MAG: aldehyde dehydrogenase [Proteobacteria bacterium]|nr:aldehyde dehydrogenase [Pseudomonadota bacterium]